MSVEDEHSFAPGIEDVETEIDKMLIDTIMNSEILEEDFIPYEVALALMRAAYIRGAVNQKNDPSLLDRLEDIHQHGRNLEL